MAKLKEQTGVPRADCPTWARNPAPSQYDEEEYEEPPRRMPTSTRRYQPIEQPAPTRTFVRVTRHQEPPPPRIARASRTQPPPQAQEDRPVQRQVQQPRGFHLHWLLIVGMFAIVMLVGWSVISALLAWWQIYQDDQHYGRPRTFQTDAVVGHHDSKEHPSHFIAQNLVGHIYVLEFLGEIPPVVSGLLCLLPQRYRGEI